MNRFSRLVFDDYVSSTDILYTSIDDMAEMAQGRQMGIMAVCTRFTPNTSTLETWIEHSGDGRYFAQKNASREIGGWKLQQTGGLTTTTIYAGEAAPARPMMRHARLAVQMSVPSARLQITVVVRGSPSAESVAVPAVKSNIDPRRMAAAGSAARHDLAMEELRRMADVGRHLPPQERAAWMHSHASPETRAHLQEMDRRYRSLSPAARRSLLESTADLMRRAVHLSRTERMTGAGAAAAGCCGPEEMADKPAGCGCDDGAKS